MLISIIQNNIIMLLRYSCRRRSRHADNNVIYFMYCNIMLLIPLHLSNRNTISIIHVLELDIPDMESVHYYAFDNILKCMV